MNEQPKHSRYILPRPQFPKGLNCARPAWYKTVCAPFYLCKTESYSFLKKFIDIELRCKDPLERRWGGYPEWVIFHGACYYGRLEIVDYMLSIPFLGINNNRNNIHQTVLLSAIWGNQIEVVRRLLEHPLINVNKRGCCGIFPLELAVSKVYIEIVKLLLAHPKIQVNQRTKEERLTDLGRCLELQADQYTYTALDIAVMRDNLELFKLLLENGAETSNALFHASRNGNLEAVEILLEIPGVNYDDCLQIAAFHGHFWVVERLLKVPEIGNYESGYMYALEQALDIYSDDLQHQGYYKKNEMKGKKLCAYILMNHHSKNLNRYLTEIYLFTNLPKLPLDIHKEIAKYLRFVHPHFKNEKFLKDWKRLTSIDNYGVKETDSQPFYETEDVSSIPFTKYAFHE